MIILLTVLASIAFAISLTSLLMYSKKSKKLDLVHRMRRHGTAVQLNKKDNPIEKPIIRFYKFVQRIAKPLVEINLAQSIEYKLNQAGLPLLGGEYVIINLMAVATVGVVVWLITFSEKIALGAAAAVPVMIWAVVLFLISRRLEAFTEQLGDCLITISNALRAGYSFQQTIEVIAKEMEPPIGDEFARMNHDVFMGVPLEEALETANKRIGSSDFELVVTAVLIQREVGGNLAQVLDNISYTIMERIRMRREILALTAQGRLSAVVLLLMPFAIGAVMFVLNHDNFVQLFEDPMGQMAIGGSLVLEVIGFFVIRRIVDIDT